jgi:xylono-1,5-lactonase
MKIGALTSVASVGAMLGEGPIWSAGEAALWFVDIKGRKIFRFDPQSRELKSWDTPSPVGWILPVATGGWIIGLKDGLCLFDAASGTFTPYYSVETNLANNRLNDATVGPDGRLWFGTMDDGERALTGRIYSFRDRQVVDASLPPVCITNGPAINGEGNLLYHTDTLGGLIYVSDLNATGMLSNTRLFAQIPASEGYPDGPIVDAEGCVWTGLFAGWAARRYSPQGELLETIGFPVANVTKLTFGGPNLTTLYATTASKGLSSNELAAQPLAGNVFSVETDVAGLKCAAVSLDS